MYVQHSMLMTQTSVLYKPEDTVLRYCISTAKTGTAIRNFEGTVQYIEGVLNFLAYRICKIIFNRKIFLDSIVAGYQTIQKMYESSQISLFSSPNYCSCSISARQANLRSLFLR
jgi:hypothetical protein